MTHERLSHIGICVSDLARSVEFYRDLLGFRELSRLEVSGKEAAQLLALEDVELEAVYLERDGTRIELLHFSRPGESAGETPRPMNRPGLTHLSLRTEDLDATLRRLEASGIAALPGTHIERPEFETAAVFVSDPDGTRIELVQSPGDLELLPGQAPATRPTR